MHQQIHSDHARPPPTRHLNFEVIDGRLGDSMRRRFDQLLAAHTPSEPAAATTLGGRRLVPRLRRVGERREAHEAAARARGDTRGRVGVRAGAARCGDVRGGVCESSEGRSNVRREREDGSG